MSRIIEPNYDKEMIKCRFCGESFESQQMYSEVVTKYEKFNYCSLYCERGEE